MKGFLMCNCAKCKKYGLSFPYKKFGPKKLIEGNPKSKVWIVGLNPKEPKSNAQKKEIAEKTDEKLLKNMFKDKNNVHSYFSCFKSVSEQLLNLLSTDKAAHVDIVKCWSKSFPPGVDGANGKNIIKECEKYLKSQLKKYKPKLIICNGIAACESIKMLIPQKKQNTKTSYTGEYAGGTKVTVVFSGQIGGRSGMDRYSMWRLGDEIEKYLKKI
ncbi:MAG: uracil-DNA glycosylase family protein [Calditrichales bacterium]|nr:uracil-DNA glycosylase family protein [Calditrichales bacterium]